MPDYIQDPNDSKKQVPGPKTYQHYDRFVNATPHSMSKTPNYIIVNADLTNSAGFFMGTSASFS